MHMVEGVADRGATSQEDRRLALWSSTFWQDGGFRGDADNYRELGVKS